MNNLQAIVNSIGLVLDIAGAIMLFAYGLPEAIDRHGHQHIILEQVDEAEIAKAARYDKMGRLGLFLLILGFVVQLASNFMK